MVGQLDKTTPLERVDYQRQLFGEFVANVAEHLLLDVVS
jgi:hypothetical protein